MKTGPDQPDSGVEAGQTVPPHTILLDAAALHAWDGLTGRPAKHLPSLARLAERTPPWPEDTASENTFGRTSAEGTHANTSVEAAAGPDGTYLRIPTAAGGVWKVVTRSSEHLFDLDTGRYMRTPEGGQPFDHDGRWCQVTRAEVEPQVGGKFFLWFDDPDTPELVEHWRQSSTITHIEPAV